MEALNLKNLSVLVVEDNDFMSQIIVRILRVFKVVDITRVDSGRKARELVQSNKFDICFLDWEIKDLNGIELTKFIREETANNYVPIIMITGFSTEDYIKKARDAGITEYVTKPLSAESIYKRIEAVIRRPRKFIRNFTYFGPDRRRTVEKDRGKYNGPERRSIKLNE